MISIISRFSIPTGPTDWDPPTTPAWCFLPPVRPASAPQSRGAYFRNHQAQSSSTIRRLIDSSLLHSFINRTAEDNVNVRNATGYGRGKNAQKSLDHYTTLRPVIVVIYFGERTSCTASNSATSAKIPGPKPSARQGPATPLRRRRSRMNKIVGEDMLPHVASTSRDTDVSARDSPSVSSTTPMTPGPPG